MKKRLFFIIMMLLLIPSIVYAKDNGEFKRISETTKYYKTIYYNYDIDSKKGDSETIEVSKEEYDTADVNGNNKGPGTSETAYKKLTTYISASGSRYLYETQMFWKNIPSVRSYDVIAIGFLANVSQYYCDNYGYCTTGTSYISKTSSSGCGAVFKLPSGSLSVLTSELSFIVDKNTSSTITYQAAYGDYAHATSNITSTQAQNYSIGTSGIVFDSSVIGYFDSMAPAMATWSGSW